MGNSTRLVARILGTAIIVLVVIPLAPGAGHSKTITQIIDPNGDGLGNILDGASGMSIAVDGIGNVYVAGFDSDNAFKITPEGAISEIINSTGDGAGNPFFFPIDIVTDGSGNVYIASPGSANAFRIDPNGVITEIIAGNILFSAIAVDGSGNVYVTGRLTDNAFKITPGGVSSEIIDSTGDGAGNTLTVPDGIAVDGSGNVYVASGGGLSNSAFRIDPNGAITEIIDSTGDGAGNTLSTGTLSRIAVDGSGNVYVAGGTSDNAFKITPEGVISEIIDSTGDGAGNPLDGPTDIEVDGSGNVYIAGFLSDNAFRIDPNGVITEIINSTGDGLGNTLNQASGIAVDGSGNVYVAGGLSNNAFQIQFICGDGMLDPGEECDDGNNDGEDGCSSTCRIELGFVCQDEPSICEMPALPQDKDQQRCINALNKNFAKVVKAKGGVVCDCIKKGAKGQLIDPTIEDCLLADPKGKVEKATGKTVSDAGKNCSKTPDFGPNDPKTANDAAIQKELDLIHDIFGSDLDVVIATEAIAIDKPRSKCQQAVAKSVKKCQGAKLKEFNSCKKNGLKDQTIQNFLDLQGCMGQDPKGKIAKACDPTTGKIRSTINKKCGSVDFPGAFPQVVAIPGCGTDDPATLAACLDQIVECRVCLALNQGDNLARDCDEFDDGVVNGSCP